MNLALQKTTLKKGQIEELEKGILLHPAWHGSLSGMDCEDLLRGKPLFSYILRAGEERLHYYLSFVLDNPFSFKHQPFKIDTSAQKWFYRNLTPHSTSNIEKLVSLIMHCEPSQCLPLIKPTG